MHEFETLPIIDELKSKKLLSCHKCNSIKVEKTIMAPQLINRKSNKIGQRMRVYENNSYNRYTYMSNYRIDNSEFTQSEKKFNIEIYIHN